MLILNLEFYLLLKSIVNIVKSTNFEFNYTLQKSWKFIVKMHLIYLKNIY